MSSTATTFTVLSVLAYLLGSVPFGVLACRAKGVDIFSVGSGNPGATNVSRAIGKTWGGIVFALDVAKGIVPALVARFLISSDLGPIHAQALWMAVGLMAVVGHCASIFLGFRGGKGIATSLGVGLAASPMVALPAFGIFLIVFAVTRYVSLASILAVPSAVILGWFMPGQARELCVVYLLLAGFVIYRHRGNIRRLREGTEPKFGAKKSADPTSAG